MTKLGKQDISVNTNAQSSKETSFILHILVPLKYQNPGENPRMNPDKEILIFLAKKIRN